MNALQGPVRTADDTRPLLRPMTVGDLDAVLAIEALCYSHPWTRGNFIDSLAAGYLALVQEGPGDTAPPPAVSSAKRPFGMSLGAAQQGLLAYLVAMPGPGELHLLNLTVAPGCQGQGHGQGLLKVLCVHARALAAHSLWLEVRKSNLRAQALYRRFGFEQVGSRPRYYPAAGEREDAVVMSMSLAAEPMEPSGADWTPASAHVAPTAQQPQAAAPDPMRIRHALD